MTRFVETSISRQISDAVTYARNARRAAAVVGPPGIGKTRTLRHIAEKEPRAIYLTISRSQATTLAAMRLIADACGIWCGQDSADRVFRALENALPNMAALGDFLILDEAQRLDLNSLVEIVDFPGMFGLPVIIAGNGELLKRSRVQAAAFAQIASRCAKQVHLKQPLKDDFESLMIDFDVYGQVARDAGVNYGLATSIRELVQMLEVAKNLAGQAPVGVPEMQRAAIYVRGGNHALKLMLPAD